MNSGAEFGRETVTGAHGRLKWVLRCGAWAGLGRAQDVQALIRNFHPQVRLKEGKNYPESMGVFRCKPGES